MAGRKLKDSVAEHREKSDRSAGVAVITLSMSRSIDTDKSGDVILNLLETNGRLVISAISVNSPVASGCGPVPAL